jgi:thiol-disulfide isomerase/thioredoxin
VKVIGADGKPLPDFPEFQFAIVEYWAEWCEPCKSQPALLRRILAAHKDLAANVFHVEADPMKIMRSDEDNESWEEKE